MRAYLRGAAVMLLAVVAACGSGDGGTAGTTTTPVPDTTTPTTVVPPVTLAPTTVAPATTAPAEVVDVKVYLLHDGNLVIGHRGVSAPAVLRGALTALLEGPTPAERAAGLTSTVPDGTVLRDVALADGLATVDLTSEFGSGGGSMSMLARVAQVVFTATQFPNVDRVAFRMDGAPVDYLGGEGLDVQAPQSRQTVDRSLTGGIVVDTPSPGATVRSPVRVTGEGDVYEGQFGIEVWAGDRQVGGAEGVWAGAWGSWAPFEATIDVDAPPGPIEIVLYDAGGCGTGPECPPVVKTVVPVTLAG